jgi:hypothetical protein
LTPLLKPTTLGDVATYFFASLGGLFLGGELGMWIYSWTYLCFSTNFNHQALREEQPREAAALHLIRKGKSGSRLLLEGSELMSFEEKRIPWIRAPTFQRSCSSFSVHRPNIKQYTL